ncbi:MAG: vWA domain-containing protein [Phycisphaerales bacterium]
MQDARQSGTDEPHWADGPDAVSPEPASARRRVSDWVLRASMSAAGLSILIHLALWGIAAIIYVGGIQAGGGGVAQAGGGNVGVAVMTEAELGGLQEAAINSETPAIMSASDATASAAESELPIADVFGQESDQAGALSSGLGNLSQGLGAGDLSSGPGLGSGGAGGGAASFFGVEARGTRFAYVCDVSGSMEVGVGTSERQRIDVLKSELANSIKALEENARFFVALFSDGARPLGARLEWTKADESGKAWAKKVIPLLMPAGATEPLDAFRMVFSLRPRPEAIYFMTDGEFNPEYANTIERMNADYRVPIHCISFISREGEVTMRKIATESGGTYTHVPGPMP